MTTPFPMNPIGRAVLLLAVLLLAGPVMAQEFQRTFSLDSKELELNSLVGQVTIRQADDDRFRVVVDVRGEDAAEDLITFQVKEGSRAELKVLFPTEEHRKYVYPALDGGGQTTITFHGQDQQERSWLKKVFGSVSGRKVTIRKSGNGLRVWADLVVEVPRGRVLHLEQGAGAVAADEMAADLVLDISSGAIKVGDIAGDVVLDTGAGEVRARGIRGSLNIDTGSGEVYLADVEADKVNIDTGSGDVDLIGIACGQLLVDTGSGDVNGQQVKAGRVNIDTGKGAVDLQLDGMGAGKHLIDTGSGDITLVLPVDASARITAETGSGRIHNMLTGATVDVNERDELDMTVGEGEARFILDAGSGSITIR
jgi:DUF4097 and DUF4098 domain-containing protein YvlB